MEPCSIAVVDDHPLIRDGISQLFSLEDGFTIIWHAEDTAGAMQNLRTCRPSVIIIDLALKESSGIDLIRNIHSQWPEIRILVLSMYDEFEYAPGAIRAGAHGYVMKETLGSTIVLAVREVLAGKIYLSSQYREKVVLGSVSGFEKSLTGAVALFSPREKEVFTLLGRGLSTREIASELTICLKTAETYQERLKEKCNVRNKADLLKCAIRYNQGLL